jgi:hypothetical protein
LLGRTTSHEHDDAVRNVPVGIARALEHAEAGSGHLRCLGGPCQEFKVKRWTDPHDQFKRARFRQSDEGKDQL